MSKEYKKDWYQKNKARLNGKQNLFHEGFKERNGIHYATLHNWIRKNIERTHFCPICFEFHDKTEFANISQEYKKDVKDYIELCRPCHRDFDSVIKLNSVV